MAISNSQLAIQMESLVQAWSRREREYAAWNAGAPDGGPQGDGRYPLTDALGVVRLVLSPAALADGVSGPAATALGAVEAVSVIRDAVATQAQRVGDLQVLVTASETAAKRWRDEAALARENAQSHEANAQVHRQYAELARVGTASDLLGTTALHEDTQYQAAWAENWAVEAKAAADRAGNFDPLKYATKADGLTQIDGLQAALGARLLTSAFTWGNLPGKPTTFAPAAHGHAWGEISDKPTSFAPSAHSHPEYASATDAVTTSATNLGKTGNGGLIGGTRDAAWWGTLPSGYSTMVNLTTANGAPTNGYGYFFKLARRDNSNGWSGLWTSHGGASRRLFLGFANDQTVMPSWNEVWTDGNFDPSAKANASHTMISQGNIPDGTDLNTYLVPCVVRQNVTSGASLALNYPSAERGTLVVFNGFGSNGTIGTQLYYARTSNRVWQRSYSLGEFTPWAEQWNTDNFDPSSKANLSGGNAFTGVSKFKNTGEPGLQIMQEDEQTAMRFGPAGGISFKTNGVWQTPHGNIKDLMFGRVGEWNNSAEGYPRFFFTDKARTYIRGYDGVEFRNASDETTFLVQEGGNLISTGDVFGGNSKWFRVRGNTGILWESHGGGWFMSDSTWIRAHGNKSIYTPGEIRGGSFSYGDGVKLPRITSGTAGPSGGADGDLYVQF